jgi:ABC-2 type transport system permease protein
MALDFGLVAMAVGALSGRRGTALGIGTAIAAASYLVSSLAPVVSWLEPAKYTSLLYWSIGDNQLGSGVAAIDYAVLLGVFLQLSTESSSPSVVSMSTDEHRSWSLGTVSVSLGDPNKISWGLSV